MSSSHDLCKDTGAQCPAHMTCANVPDGQQQACETAGTCSYCPATGKCYQQKTCDRFCTEICTNPLPSSAPSPSPTVTPTLSPTPTPTSSPIPTPTPTATPLPVGYLTFVTKYALGTLNIGVGVDDKLIATIVLGARDEKTGEPSLVTLLVGSDPAIVGDGTGDAGDADVDGGNDADEGDGDGDGDDGVLIAIIVTIFVVVCIVCILIIIIIAVILIFKKMKNSRVRDGVQHDNGEEDNYDATILDQIGTGSHNAFAYLRRKSSALMHFK
eukprot:TRINITY_DN1657_c1_g1_i6.p1 TRINITY_DN1657_c1_g1~~TRINITY_DN1657_c1_g1_i6.p1  ORF type:complete len:270 (+),score=50.63 TRINITY_DN1657_c1_g1_i6:638-1447(+)